ncbi:MAG: helix-turn-helix transcriptional regulator [Rikenellaceae bacterium]
MNLRIKEICKEKGILQKELALLLGVTDIALRASLKGNPTINTLEKVATALGVELVELFEKKDDFVALISMDGTNYRFDNIKATAEFLNKINEEK